jgi:hypothetical protein
MPNFKDPSYFFQLPTNTAFDVIYKPGDHTPVSGIYRCVSCGFEIVSTHEHPLPPTMACTNHSLKWKNHHGLVRWKLVAAAIHATP